MTALLGRLYKFIQFFAASLAVVAFICAIDYFQSETKPVVKLAAPVAVTDFERFAAQVNDTSNLLMPCVRNCMQNHDVAHYYTMEISSSVPTLVNPPFLITGTSYYLIHNFNSNQYVTLNRHKSVRQSTPTIDELMSEKALLDHAVSAAGYGTIREDNDKTITSDEALLNPFYLSKYLSQRYGVEISTVPHYPGGVIYLNIDFFPTCINQIASMQFRSNAYYALASSRLLWNTVKITNTSRHPIQDVTVYIERPWQGITDLVEKVVVAEGGVVVHSSPFYYVVRFPLLLSNSSKIVVLKTRGTPLLDNEVSVESIPVRTPSMLLLWGLSGIAFILAILYAASGIWDKAGRRFFSIISAAIRHLRRLRTLLGSKTK